MHQTITASMGWRIQAWEEPSAGAASQDGQLVWPDVARDRLRVAVLDGVTPTRNTRTVAGVAGAMYAAAVARLALQQAGCELEECLLAANRHLHERGLARSRDQLQTCATVADVFPDGRVEVVRAGDCEAWARTAEGWVPLGCGTALTPSVAQAWDEWQRTNASVSRETRHVAEEQFLGRREAWTSTALGRFERPRIQRFSATGVYELVLASDGARLSEPVLDELPEWISGLRAWERRRAGLGRAGEKVHDDVTVLRLVRGAVPLALVA
jgi:serine/threonine protein phosphatase PrpC